MSEPEPEPLPEPLSEPDPLPFPPFPEPSPDPPVAVLEADEPEPSVLVAVLESEPDPPVLVAVLVLEPEPPVLVAVLVLEAPVLVAVLAPEEPSVVEAPVLVEEPEPSVLDAVLDAVLEEPEPPVAEPVEEAADPVEEAPEEAPVTLEEPELVVDAAGTVVAELEGGAVDDSAEEATEETQSNDQQKLGKTLLGACNLGKSSMSRSRSRSRLISSLFSKSCLLDGVNCLASWKFWSRAYLMFCGKYSCHNLPTSVLTSRSRSSSIAKPSGKQNKPLWMEASIRTDTEKANKLSIPVLASAPTTTASDCKSEPNPVTLALLAELAKLWKS